MTTDPETLSKDPKWVLWCTCVIGKIGHFKEYEGVYTSDFLFFSMQVKTRTFAEIDDAMVYLKQPARA